ncbi:MAG: hypothetical protein P8R43_06980, partial [Planctomycetota bacterium]|nr:hypothetical protein [Planctomycetota bacterium]
MDTRRTLPIQLALLPVATLGALLLAGEGELAQAGGGGVLEAEAEAGSEAGSGAARLAGSGADRPDFDALRVEGAHRSQYRGGAPGLDAPAELATDLDSYRREIEPLLESACLGCHGPDKEKGGFRLDELDPDLVQGDDVDWWLDVLSVVSNGEMPP